MWLILLGSAAALADCVVESSMDWKGDSLAGTVSVVVTDGPVPCRTLDIGAVHKFQLTKLKGVVRSWDGSKIRVGMERLANEGGRWTAYLPELRVDSEAKLKFVGVPSGTGEAWSAVESEQAPEFFRTEVRWMPVDKPSFGPGGNVAMDVRRSARVPAGKGAHRFWFPTGVIDQACTGVGQDGEVPVSLGKAGCALQARAQEDVTVSISWRVPHASSAMEWVLDPGESLEISDARVLSAGLESAPTDALTRFVGPGRVSVRVTQLGDVSIPDKALEAVRFGATARSMAEPGVGVEYKGKDIGVSDLLPLLEQLRESVVTGRLPEQHPLKPRYLLKARASGWATPWESALILSRYLEQLGFDARPLPVRPGAQGVAAAGAPVGYTGAVVSVEKDGQQAWLDPSCRACGVNEIAPELWGGAVFDDGIEFMPPAPDSLVTQELDGDVLRVHLAGPAAVTFRHFTLDIPSSEPRETKIAELFGGPQAVLRGATGIGELGSPIDLLIEVQSLK